MALQTPQRGAAMRSVEEEDAEAAVKAGASSQKHARRTSLESSWRRMGGSWSARMSQVRRSMSLQKKLLLAILLTLGSTRAMSVWAPAPMSRRALAANTQWLERNVAPRAGHTLIRSPSMGGLSLAVVRGRRAHRHRCHHRLQRHRRIGCRIHAAPRKIR